MGNNRKKVCLARSLFLGHIVYFFLVFFFFVASNYFFWGVHYRVQEWNYNFSICSLLSSPLWRLPPSPRSGVQARDVSKIRPTRIAKLDCRRAAKENVAACLTI